MIVSVPFIFPRRRRDAASRFFLRLYFYRFCFYCLSCFSFLPRRFAPPPHKAVMGERAVPEPSVPEPVEGSKGRWGEDSTCSFSAAISIRTNVRSLIVGNGLKPFRILFVIPAPAFARVNSGGYQSFLFFLHSSMSRKLNNLRTSLLVNLNMSPE